MSTPEAKEPLVSARWKRETFIGGATRNELYAEFLGTFTLILGGCSAVAQAVHRAKDNHQDTPVDTFSQCLQINFGWGLAVACGVIVSFDASGAHLNPAVTLSEMLHNGMPASKGLAYILFQCIGAFWGAVLTMLIFTAWPGQLTKYGSNYYHTGPSSGTPFGSAVLTEIVATAFLLIPINFVANTSDPGWAPTRLHMAAALFCIVFGIGVTFGYQTGYSLNPARDAMPRLVRLIQECFFSEGAGWNSLAVMGAFNGSVETGDIGIISWRSWVPPIFGPLLGGPLGTWVWKFFSKPKKGEQQPGEIEVELS